MVRSTLPPGFIKATPPCLCVGQIVNQHSIPYLLMLDKLYILTDVVSLQTR
jgi:hypothetical protein